MMPPRLVRNAVLEILRKSSEPATTRELVEAVYYFTGDDRVGYGNVQSALRFLADDGLVRHADRMWWAVPS